MLDAAAAAGCDITTHVNQLATKQLGIIYIYIYICSSLMSLQSQMTRAKRNDATAGLMHMITYG